MRCEYCQKEYPVEDEKMVGQEVQCPYCQIPSVCSDQRILVQCPSCGKELETELWMLGNTAECSYCGKDIVLSRPENPGDLYSNSYLPPNYILGNYTIKRCVGIGGMGEVYLVRHNLLERQCALKLLRPSASSGVASVESFNSLINEARLACRIQSPNIIAVLDAQINHQRNLGYIVMEFVEGNDLENLINGQPMNEDSVLSIVREVTLALIEAAAFDVVHRDIKPANIMITNSGETKLADLGIAKTKKNIPGSGRIIGTVNYAPPEQLISSDDVDCRADIYSLGATMYHMLSGKRPFDGVSPMTVMNKVLKSDFQPLEKAAPNVSKETCRLVKSMMSHSAAKRPANAKKLLAELDKVIAARSRKFFVMGHGISVKMLLGAAGAAAALLGIGAAVFYSIDTEEASQIEKISSSTAAVEEKKVDAPKPPVKKAVPPSISVQKAQPVSPRPAQISPVKAAKTPAETKSAPKVPQPPVKAPASKAPAASPAPKTKTQSVVTAPAKKVPAAPVKKTPAPAAAKAPVVNILADIPIENELTKKTKAAPAVNILADIPIENELTKKTKAAPAVNILADISVENELTKEAPKAQTKNISADALPKKELSQSTGTAVKKAVPDAGIKKELPTAAVTAVKKAEAPKAKAPVKKAAPKVLTAEDIAAAEAAEELRKELLKDQEKMRKAAEKRKKKKLKKAKQSDAPKVQTQSAAPGQTVPAPGQPSVPGTAQVSPIKLAKQMKPTGGKGFDLAALAKKLQPKMDIDNKPVQQPAAAPGTAPAQGSASAASAQGTPATSTPAAEPVPQWVVPAVTPGSKINFFRLLFLFIWLLSGLKVLSYLKEKKIKNDPFVTENFGYLNLASLVAGPLVYLLVEFNTRYADKIRDLLTKKEVLPELLDSSGKPILQEGRDEAEEENIFYLRRMLFEALKLHASDIYIDPEGNDSVVLRFRVEGSLRPVDELDTTFSARIINLIKFAAAMNISERVKPQEGLFYLSGSFGNVSLRAASVGTFNGEKMTLHIVGDETAPKTFAEAGLKGKELLIMEQAVRATSGIVLICGPSGCGKSSTLYAMLNAVDSSTQNVITIEDPIEHLMPSVTQMEVNEAKGVTFAQLLRNALPQNPDILCLSDIRDAETAKMAVYAAQTGHLVFATLNSNDNISSIDRLAGFNVPLRSLAGTLRLIVSQRLVRKLCSCKKHRAVTEEEEALFRKYDIECSKVSIPKGCKKCSNTGYSGQTAIFDFLAIDENLRASLEDEHTNLSNIRKQLERFTHGSVMERIGCELVAEGVTSIDEIRRVTMELKD